MDNTSFLEIVIKTEPIFKFLQNKICNYCNEKANSFCLLSSCIEAQKNYFCISCLMRNEQCKIKHFSNHENHVFDYFNQNFIELFKYNEIELEKFIKKIEDKNEEFTKNVDIIWREIEEYINNQFKNFLERLKKNFYEYNENNNKKIYENENTIKNTNLLLDIKNDLKKNLEKISSINTDINENDFYEITKDIFQKRFDFQKNLQNIFDYNVNIYENENKVLINKKKQIIQNCSTIENKLKPYIYSSFFEIGIHIDKPLPFKDFWKKLYFENYSHVTTNNIIDNIKQNNLNEDIIFVGTFRQDDVKLEKPILFAIDTVGSALKKTNDTSKANKSETVDNLYWYFYEGKSFGFSKIEKISLGSADTENEQGEFKLSWHLTGNNGWRSGNNTSLSSNEFKKAILII